MVEISIRSTNIDADLTSYRRESVIVVVLPTKRFCFLELVAEETAMSQYQIRLW
jgi:hypothetical protein